MEFLPAESFACAENTKAAPNKDTSLMTTGKARGKSLYCNLFLRRKKQKGVEFIARI
jgi:hypothetical protein